MVEKVVKPEERIVTVKLDGEVCKVVFDRKFRCFNIQNRGTSDVDISFSPDIVADEDGVSTIQPNETILLAFVKETDTIYLNGSGKVNVSAGYLPVNTYLGTTGSGSGSSGGDIIAPDDSELVDEEDIDNMFDDSSEGNA